VVSSSDFRCKTPKCGRLLGQVEGNRLVHEQGAEVRNLLRDGCALVTCPICKGTRVFRGGVVEIKRDTIQCAGSHAVGA